MLHRDGITQTKPIQGNALNGRVERKIEPATAVHSTRNYSQFRFSDANRPINQRHLERLHDAVETKNLLERYPILVTPEFVVIDGQHRLKVAEALRVPIYYIVADNMAVDDISRINDVTLKWNLRDYLHYWTAKGNEDYKTIAAFAQKWSDVGLSHIVQYVTPMAGQFGTNGYVYAFRAGKADAGRLTQLEKALVAAHDFKPYIKKRWTQASFLSAVAALLATPGYSHATMLRRLEYQSTRLVPCVRVFDYLALFSEIYNYKTHKENQMDFSKSLRMRMTSRPGPKHTK
jgi:hypothetical protein